MSSLNKAMLIGNLGRDPEVRHTQEGSKIVTLSVATSERWKDRNTGEQRERTEWHRVVIFNDRLGDVAEQYLRKGSKVYLSGKLQTRKWTDQSGQEKYTTEIVLQKFQGEIVLLGERGGNGGGQPAGGSTYGGADSAGSSYGSAPASQPAAQPTSPPAAAAEFDDEIPF